ncbi:MAG: MBL fold metallo-hydrolase [Dactylosporangium sp.]|nr:MBL fold metallo-hydrolase [Dactylosporangium sp.]NNJ60342.1 MBL fold metallo-hydrolase [Dactylosporangium sp.]
MSEQLPPPSAGVVFDRDGLRIHTFTAPEAFLANSTHIIETANALVVVDGQFVVPYARAFRAYADGLGKPIERVFLSHAHVDHFFGLGAAFADVPIHAPAQTIATLDREGESLRVERAQQYGPLVPDRIVMPQHAVIPGVETIDGLKYELAVVAGAECGAQLVITLPDIAVTVAQDLIYSGAHVYVTRDTQNWISTLGLLAESASTLFLAGHGPVADTAEVRRTIDYLTFAQQTLATAADPQAFKAALLAAYPERTGAVILDICVPRLYAETSE